MCFEDSSRTDSKGVLCGQPFSWCEGNGDSLVLPRLGASRVNSRKPQILRMITCHRSVAVFRVRQDGGLIKVELGLPVTLQALTCWQGVAYQSHSKAQALCQLSVQTDPTEWKCWGLHTSCQVAVVFFNTNHTPHTLPPIHTLSHIYTHTAAIF